MSAKAGGMAANVNAKDLEAKVKDMYRAMEQNPVASLQVGPTGRVKRRR